MKRILPFFFTCLSISNSYAQTNARDSLKQLLQKEKTDTGRVLLLADLSFEYLESKPDTTMILALEALSLARRIGFLKGEAISLNRVGNAYHVLGNYPKAMEKNLQALKINEKINNQEGVASNYNNIGLIHSQQEDYRQALYFFFKAKDLAENLSNKKSVSIHLTNIGETYYFLKNYDSARLFSQQANNIATGIQYFRMIGNSFRIMGDINSATGQNTLSSEYYRLGIPYLIKAGQYQSLSQTFLGIAKVFEKIPQNDSVLFYARQSLALAEEMGFTRRIQDAGRFLTGYYRKVNKPDSAFFYLDLTKAANDSLFSMQKQRQLQSLAFDEKLRQQEIAAAELKSKEERKNNLQYAAIVVSLISFIIVFFILSRSIIVKEKFIKFFGIVGLLAVFEFINLYIHPYLDKWTNHSPFWMLAILICIGALLVPLHHKLEKWITKIMVEKNKKIRLAAAKKTIAKLEG